MFLRRALLIGLCGVALISAKPAWASGCTNPVGVAGDQIYSVTYNMMQFCNGNLWINMSANIGVGSLTSGDWCTTDGTLINCTTVPPLQTAAGSDTQIMFNHSGAYAGSSSFVWDYTHTRLGIGTASPASVIDVSQTTNAIALPVGSAAQRPSTGALNGMICYNNGGTGSVEALINNSWVSLLSNGSTVVGSNVAATGADTDVQYNKAGTLYADGNLTWNYGANTLTVIGTVGATTLTGSGAGITSLNAGNVSSGILPVTYGGMGAATFTTNGVLYGNAAGAIQATGQGAAHTILTANAGPPTWSAAPVIGTSVTTPLLIGGTAAGSALTLESTSAAGSGDYIAFLTGSQNEKMRILSSGSVGIGTTNPGATFTVGNNAFEVTSAGVVTDTGEAVNGTLIQTGGYAYLGNYNSGGTYPAFPGASLAIGNNFSSGNAELNIWNVINPSTFANTGIRFMQELTSSTYRDLMFISNTGYVGIGTTSPGAPLDVENSGGSVRLAQFLLPSESNGGLAQIVVGHDASTNYAQGALTYTYNSTTPSLSYVSLGNNTTNSAMLNVLGNGNVGIGSTNPVVALDIGQKTDGLLLPRGATSQRPASPVNGTLRYNSDSSAVEVYQNSVWNNVSAGGAATAGGSAGQVQFNGINNVLAGSSSLFWDNTNLRLGIGTTSPGDKLQVYGGGAYIGDASSKLWVGPSGGTNYIESGNAAWNAVAPLIITGDSTNPISLLTLQATNSYFTGSVGIGTVSPNGKFEVNNGNGGDGIVLYAPSDNNQSIQSYIDGHWSDRLTYGGPCCNNLNINAEVGYVTIGNGLAGGGISLNAGTTVNSWLTVNNTLNVSGNNSLYFNSWGGGFYMSDTTWVRVVNNKNIYTPANIRANSELQTNNLCDTNGANCVTPAAIAAAVAAAMPSGMIAAFATTTCPSGWSEYTAARGAFLRGIDNGAGRDPAGTRSPGAYAGDTFASHSHGVNDPGHSHTVTWSQSGWGGANMNSSYLAGIDSNRAGAKSLGSSASTTGISIQNTGSSETAPKNVAVLFCSKN